MVVEVCEGEIKFIHSSVSNGVIISSTEKLRKISLKSIEYYNNLVPCLPYIAKRFNY
jgi:hypothetical protein